MKKLLISIGAIFVAGTLALVACGTSKSSDTTPVAAATATSAPGATGTTAPDGTVTFAITEAILKSYCVGCHAKGGSGFDATSLASATKNAALAADYMQGKKTLPMPTSGRIDTTADGAKLLKWFLAGAAK